MGTLIVPIYVCMIRKLKLALSIGKRSLRIDMFYISNEALKCTQLIAQIDFSVRSIDLDGCVYSSNKPQTAQESDRTSNQTTEDRYD